MSTECFAYNKNRSRQPEISTTGFIHRSTSGYNIRWLSIELPRLPLRRETSRECRVCTSLSHQLLISIETQYSYAQLKLIIYYERYVIILIAKIRLRFMFYTVSVYSLRKTPHADTFGFIRFKIYFIALSGSKVAKNKIRCLSVLGLENLWWGKMLIKFKIWLSYLSSKKYDEVYRFFSRVRLLIITNIIIDIIYIFLIEYNFSLWLLYVISTQVPACIDTFFFFLFHHFSCSIVLLLHFHT